MIAVLYNTLEELLEFKKRWEPDLVLSNPLLPIHTYTSLGDVIFCKCNYEEVFQRLHSTILSGYVVAGEGLYCGKALQFAASRVRETQPI